MKFEREHYIEKLISSKHNHLIKIVTGLRRVGKSYLLLNLYKQHLLDNDVDASHIIEIKLDSFAHRKYRKAETLLLLSGKTQNRIKSFPNSFIIKGSDFFMIKASPPN